MIKLIAACDPYGGIGFKGKIPWHIPEDLKLFKHLTTGHTVVMGRKTYDSIKKPLPKRHNVVITKALGNLSFHQSMPMIGDDPEKFGSLEITSNIDWAKNHDSPDKTIWIIGGSELYNYYLEKKLIEEVYLTIVNSDEICDTRIQIDHIHRYYEEDMSYKVEFLSAKENRMCSIHLFKRKPGI